MRSIVQKRFKQLCGLILLQKSICAHKICTFTEVLYHHRTKREMASLSYTSSSFLRPVVLFSKSSSSLSCTSQPARLMKMKRRPNAGRGRQQRANASFSSSFSSSSSSKEEEKTKKTKVVVLTREAGKNEQMRKILASIQQQLSFDDDTDKDNEFVVETLEMPLVESKRNEEEAKKLVDLLKSKTFRWIIVTSPEAANVFARRGQTPGNRKG